LSEHVYAQDFRVAFAGLRKLDDFLDDDIRQRVFPVTRELQDAAKPDRRLPALLPSRSALKAVLYLENGMVAPMACSRFSNENLGQRIALSISVGSDLLRVGHPRTPRVPGERCPFAERHASPAIASSGC
jgi:hypothetical protein